MQPKYNREHMSAILPSLHSLERKQCPIMYLHKLSKSKYHYEGLTVSMPVRSLQEYVPSTFSQRLTETITSITDKWSSPF